MNACLKKETLLALIDREFAADARKKAEIHLAGCADCRMELETLRAASVEIGELMDAMCTRDALDTAPPPVMAAEFARERERAFGWSAIAAAGALMACAVVAFAIYRHETRQIVPPAKNASAATDVAAVRTEAPPPTVAPSLAAIPVRHAATHTGKHVAAVAGPKTLEFISLGDGAPIETGTIVRLDVPVGDAKSLKAGARKRIPADVLLDEQGEVRAIRFLNGAQ